VFLPVPMRPAAVFCALGALLLISCSSPAPDPGALARSQSPIAYGNSDTANPHTAVVAVLSPVSGTELQECSGSIVQVTGGIGYVLTAAHCCNAYAPTVVVAANNYVVGEEYVSGGTPVPPVYPIVAGSVQSDSLYNGSDHDFCMLKFSGAPAGMPTLALPPASGDGLQLGDLIEHIGFGVTDTNNTNSVRRTGTDTLNLDLTPLILEFSQGGTTDIPGTCEGDSGGPSLLPAGVPQSQQVIVGVQSYGNSTTCSTETLGVASRVISEIGPQRFITSYLPQPAAVPATGHWAIAAILFALMALGTQQLARTARAREWGPIRVRRRQRAFALDAFGPRP
jgi:hypothetical protein